MKMKKGILLLASTCMLAFCLMGCKKEKPNDGGGQTPEPQSTFQIDKKDLTIQYGKKDVLSPLNAKGEVRWVSEEAQIADVDAKGLVKGMHAGKTRVFALNGKDKAICNVTVECTPDAKLPMLPENLWEMSKEEAIKFISTPPLSFSKEVADKGMIIGTINSDEYPGEYRYAVKISKGKVVSLGILASGEKNNTTDGRLVKFAKQCMNVVKDDGTKIIFSAVDNKSSGYIEITEKNSLLLLFSQQ